MQLEHLFLKIFALRFPKPSSRNRRGKIRTPARARAPKWSPTTSAQNSKPPRRLASFLSAPLLPPTSPPFLPTPPRASPPHTAFAARRHRRRRNTPPTRAAPLVARGAAPLRCPRWARCRSLARSLRLQYCFREGFGRGVPFRRVGGCVVSPIAPGIVAGRCFPGTGLHFAAPSSSLGLRSELSFAVSIGDFTLPFVLFCIPRQCKFFIWWDPVWWASEAGIGASFRWLLLPIRVRRLP